LSTYTVQERGKYGSRLNFVEETKLELSKIANQGYKNLPSIPIKPTLKIHWLAIDGIQPSIQENPSFDLEGSLIPSEGAKVSDGVAKIKEIVAKQAISFELQVFFNKISTAVHDYDS